MIQHGVVEMKALSNASQTIVDTVERQFVADLLVAFDQLGTAASGMWTPEAVLTESTIALIASTAVAHTMPYFKAAFASAQSEAAKQSADLVASMTGEDVNTLTSALVQAGVNLLHGERLQQLIPGLNKQTTQAITDAVQKGIESGLGPYEARKAIKEAVQGSGMYPGLSEDESARAAVNYRATVIARTETAWARNTAQTAYLGASRDVEMLYVVDGPDCGWTFHDDPDKANGKHVTFAEAQQYPISHPNCRRSFGPVYRGARATDEGAEE